MLNKSIASAKRADSILVQFRPGTFRDNMCQAQSERLEHNLWPLGYTSSI